MGQLFDDMDQVHVYDWGLCYLSACAPKEMPLKRITAVVNSSHPTGIKSQWRKAAENFVSGEPNPCPCDDEPKRRLHYLFNC
jgi:hypothetical protein